MTTRRTNRSKNPRLEEASSRIKAKGYRSVNAGLRAVDLDRTTYTHAVADGLSDNPRTKTVEKLRKLGVLEIASRPL